MPSSSPPSDPPIRRKGWKAAALVALYLSPIAGLLGYVEWVSAPTLTAYLTLAARGIAATIISISIGLALAERIRFLDCDGGCFYVRYFIPHVAIFLAACFLMGFESQATPESVIGRYTF